MAYSVDLRKRLVDVVEAGMSCRKAAAVFGVSASAAIGWVSRKKQDGVILPAGSGGDRRSAAIEAEREWLLKRMEDVPDTTLEEYRAGLAERGTTVGIGTVWRFFDRNGISYKKNSTRQRARTP